MKLSPYKKHGMLHVRAARLLRVSQEHAVSTVGANVAGSAEQVGCSHGKAAGRFEGQNWVFCKEGDLVLEIVKAKKGQLVGHSYLTGPAIQLMNYEANPGFFEETPLKVGLLEIPAGEADAGKFLEKLISNVRRAQEEEGVCVLFLSVAEDQVQSAADTIIGCWMEEETGKTHLIGDIVVEKDPGSGIHIHLQPKKHQTALSASGFQSELLINMVAKRKKKKKW